MLLLPNGAVSDFGALHLGTDNSAQSLLVSNKQFQQEERLLSALRLETVGGNVTDARDCSCVRCDVVEVTISRTTEDNPT